MAQPVDYAWAAGIIDGEGCIRLARATKGPSCYLTVGVLNSDPKMLLRLKEIFECGGITACHKGSAHRAPTWTWRVSTRQAEAVLKSAMPYLVTKREQAETALRARALVGKRGQPNARQTEIDALARSLSAMKREVA